MRALNLICLIVLVTSLGWASGVEEFPSQFLGYEAINKVINDRLFKPDSPVDIANYLGKSDLGDLLGIYSGTGLQFQFQNGTPNATNMVLWHLAMDGLSKDLGAICSIVTPTQLREKITDNFAGHLVPLCSWPAPFAKSEYVLQNFWLAVEGYDAPETEYLAWRDFFLANYTKVAPDQTVVAMIKAMLLNPYFLLRK